MVVLVLAVCLHINPTDCREVHLPMIAQSATPYQCAHNGQVAAEEWSRSHPDWRVRRWTCVPEERLERET